MAVVGCGRWGPNHIRTFSSLPGTDVAVAVDLDEARRTQVGVKFPGLRVTSDYRWALDQADVDAVVVATPTHTHYQLVHDALLAGKHVLCEKPLCMTSDGARELDELARAQRRILMVGHVFLFNPALVKLKELVDGGELGALRYLAATRTNLGPVRADANAAYDLACHDISVFNWLLGGEPEWVAAAGGAFLQPAVEDVAFISLWYPGHVLAHVHASWLHPRKTRQLEVIGSERMASWDDIDPGAPLTIYHKGVGAAAPDAGDGAALTTWDNGVWLPPVEHEEPLRAQAQVFLQAIECGVVGRSDGAFAVGVVKTLEAVTASLRQVGRPAAFAVGETHSGETPPGRGRPELIAAAPADALHGGSVYGSPSPGAPGVRAVNGAAAANGVLPGTAA